MQRPAEQPALRVNTQTARAKWAWDAVDKAGEKDERYLTEARKLPARLLTSGLGQTMAYLHAKAKGKGDLDGEGVARLYAQLCQRMREVLRRDNNIPAMKIIIDLGPREYRMLSQEMLESAEWIKRFAEGKGGGDA